MVNLFYVQYLISSCENFSKTAEEYFNKAQEKLMNDEIDLDNLYLSTFYLNLCIENTEKLLKISSENPGLLEDKEALETNLQNMKDDVKCVEEMLDYCREQLVETK